MYVLETSELNEILADYGMGYIVEKEDNLEQVVIIELIGGELC